MRINIGFREKHIRRPSPVHATRPPNNIIYKKYSKIFFFLGVFFFRYYLYTRLFFVLRVPLQRQYKHFDVFVRRFRFEDDFPLFVRVIGVVQRIYALKTESLDGFCRKMTGTLHVNHLAARFHRQFSVNRNREIVSRVFAAAFAYLNPQTRNRTIFFCPL